MPPQKKRPDASKPAPIRWVFGSDISTSNWFEGQSLENMGSLQEAVDVFVYWLKEARFVTWEAVVCQEQGQPLTAVQQQALDELIDFGDSGDDRILYIDELPRPSEPWHVILNKIVPHLLLEPLRTADMNWEVKLEGWPRLMSAFREHGQGLSLPPGVTSPEEVVPVELRHKLWLQVCLDDLSGLGQEPELNLKEQPERIEWFIDHLREHKESVEFFGLTLESLMGRLILPQADQTLFVEMMQTQLSLRSVQDRIADHL
jgi:hypothetical protein